jgi:hypothetical protein
VGQLISVIGIDPGETTGLASVQYSPGVVLDKFHVLDTQVTTPLEVWQFIQMHQGCDRVVLEAYNTSGRLGKEASLTLKIEGYVHFRCEEAGIPVHLVEASRRKSSLEWATTLAHSTKYEDRHGRDALAHVLRDIRGEVNHATR